MRSLLFPLVAFLLSIPGTQAKAESYALLNFDDQPAVPYPDFPDPVFEQDVNYPQASFAGGIVVASPTGGNQYVTFDTAGTGTLGEQLFINIAPTFPVSEIRFDVGPSGYLSTSFLSVEIDAVDASNYLLTGTLLSSPSVVDLKSPGIAAVYIDIFSPGTEYGLSIDNVELNPSLAQAAVTPEPSSLLLSMTGLGACLLASLHTGRLSRRRAVRAEG